MEDFDKITQEEVGNLLAEIEDAKVDVINAIAYKVEQTEGKTITLAEPFNDTLCLDGHGNLIISANNGNVIIPNDYSFETLAEIGYAIHAFDEED